MQHDTVTGRYGDTAILYYVFSPRLLLSMFPRIQIRGLKWTRRVHM